MIFGSHALHECVIETTETPCTVVKLNSDRKVQSTGSFFNANESFGISVF